MFDFTNNHLVYLYKEKNTIVKNDEKKKKTLVYKTKILKLHFFKYNVWYWCVCVCVGGGGY